MCTPMWLDPGVYICACGLHVGNFKFTTDQVEHRQICHSLTTSFTPHGVAGTHVRRRVSVCRASLPQLPCRTRAGGPFGSRPSSHTVLQAAVQVPRALLQRRPCPMRISAATRSRGHSSTTRATKTNIKLPRDSKCQGRRTQRPRASLKNWRAPTAPTHRAADPNSLRLAFPLPRAHLRRLCSQANLKHRRAPWCSNTKLKRANLKHRRGPRRNNTKPKRWMAQCEPLRQPAGHDAA